MDDRQRVKPEKQSPSLEGHGIPNRGGGGGGTRQGTRDYRWILLHSCNDTTLTRCRPMYLGAGGDLELLGEGRRGSRTLTRRLFRSLRRCAAERGSQLPRDEGEPYEARRHAEAEHEHQGRVPAVTPASKQREQTNAKMEESRDRVAGKVSCCGSTKVRWWG